MSKKVEVELPLLHETDRNKRVLFKGCYGLQLRRTAGNTIGIYADAPAYLTPGSGRRTDVKVHVGDFRLDLDENRSDRDVDFDGQPARKLIEALAAELGLHVHLCKGPAGSGGDAE